MKDKCDLYEDPILSFGARRWDEWLQGVQSRGHHPGCQALKLTKNQWRVVTIKNYPRWVPATENPTLLREAVPRILGGTTTASRFLIL